MLFSARAVLRGCATAKRLLAHVHNEASDRQSCAPSLCAPLTVFPWVAQACRHPNNHITIVPCIAPLSSIFAFGSAFAFAAAALSASLRPTNLFFGCLGAIAMARSATASVPRQVHPDRKQSNHRNLTYRFVSASRKAQAHGENVGWTWKKAVLLQW